MVHSNAPIDKIFGDQAAGVPGFAGPAPARITWRAAQEDSSRHRSRRPEGPWMPLEVGVHTGTTFAGLVESEEGTTDITVLGNAANAAAKLSTHAKQGAILISEAAYAAAGLQLDTLEKRDLELKGKSEPFSVCGPPC